MVDPITVAAVTEGSGIAAKIAGGLFAAARARAKGEYLATQAEEQRKLYARQYNRKLEQEVSNIAQTGGRGIEASGSVIDDIYSQSFDLILQREAVKQRLSQQASQARVTGSIQATAAIGSAFGSAFGSAMEGAQEYAKSKPKPTGDTK